MKAVVIVALCLGLAACDPTQINPPPNSKLPPIPADIRACAKIYGVDIPARRLTVSEVEQLWKRDRLKIVQARQCHARMLTWYDGLRRRWR